MQPNKCSLDITTHTSVTHGRCCTLSFLLFTLLFYLFSLAESNATIRYVSKTGSSIQPYITWETAADSIQKCINISVFGDTIYVANGIYEEQVVMIPGLSLIGAGTDSCWIDSRQLVTMQNYKTIDMKDNCLVKGFYIRSTINFDYGFGVYTEGESGLVTLNKFSEANSGILLSSSNVKVYKNYCFNIRAGVYLSNSNSIVRKNEIYTVADQIGSAIVITGFTDDYHPSIDSNYIATKTGGIRKSIGTTPTIKNNVIEYIQYGGNLIELSNSDSAYVYNNLLLVGTGRGIYNYNVPYLQIMNNHIEGNLSSSLLGMLIGGSNNVKNNVVVNTVTGIQAGGIQNLVVQYNNLWNNGTNTSGFTLDTTNLSVDPMVVNDDTTQGELDFHLQMFSPLIDAGDPNIQDKDSTRSDIGLYGGPFGESYIYIDLPPRPPVNLSASVDSLIKLNWNKNTEADFSYYNVYRDTVFNFTVDSTKLIASVTDSFYYELFPSNVETLYYKLTSVDNQGNESIPSEQVAVVLVSVKNEWVPVNNYILYQNYPNPFNPSTKIGYKLKERGYVKLYVYDIKGELVSVLVNEVQEAGYYEVGFNVGQESIPDLSSGVYIYQIFVQGENNIPVFSDVKKMLLVK